MMVDPLNSFYAELVAWIQSEVNLRIEQEGFDPAADFALQTFQKKLCEARSFHEPSSFEEVVDQYHYLFQQRGPLHL